MLTLLLGIAAVLSACSSSDASTVSQEMGELDPENPTKITFYSYSLAAPTMKEGMEHLINEFNDTIGKKRVSLLKGLLMPLINSLRQILRLEKRLILFNILFQH